MEPNETKITKDSVETPEVSYRRDNTGKTLDVRRYGADPTANVPADDAFSKAVEDAEKGDTILFRDGRYAIEQDHTITKALTIKCDNSTLYRESGAGASAIEFVGGGRTGETENITAAVEQGDETIPVSNASTFSPGDYVLIRADNYADLGDFMFQYAEVESVDTGSNTIDITGSTYAPFPDSGSGGQVDKVDLLDQPAVVDVKTEGTDQTTSWFRMEFAYRPLFEGVDLSNFIRKGMWCKDSWQPRWIDCTARNANAKTGGDGEPYKAKRCNDGRIRGCHSYDTRRSIDLPHNSHDFHISDHSAERFSVKAIGSHDSPTRNVTVSGVVLRGERTGTDSSTGIAFSDGCENILVENVDMTVSRYGVKIDGKNQQYRNISIRTNRDPSENLIQIVDPSEHIDVQAHIDTNGNGTNANSSGAVFVNASGGDIENVRLDLTGYDDAGRTVRLTTGAGDTMRDVTITGSLDGKGVAGDCVYLDGSGTFEKIDVSLDVEGYTSDAVQVKAGITVNKFRLHDACLNADFRGISFAADASDEVRVESCSITGASNDEIEIATAATYVWVVDNRAATVTIDGGATNVEQRGNL